MPRDEKPVIRLISHRTLADRLDCSTRNISRMSARDPDFPATVRVGKGQRRYYRETEVDRYFRALIARSAIPSA